jgi:cyclopropane fatty-acyl-phospholipid synthase-like methyltransferase
MIENDMGPSSLWLAEFLCQEMELHPGMRVLDLGCGRAMISIFLAREFGFQVWAADLWIRPGDNWQRIKEAGLEECVFPIHSGPYKLPFAPEFFDAVVSLDSHRYYETNDMFLKNHLVPLVKRGGQQLGIVVPDLTREFESEVPEAMQPWWDSD